MKIIRFIVGKIMVISDKTGGIKYSCGGYERFRLTHPIGLMVFILYIPCHAAYYGVINSGLIEEIKDNFCIF